MSRERLMPSVIGRTSGDTEAGNLKDPCHSLENVAIAMQVVLFPEHRSDVGSDEGVEGEACPVARTAQRDVQATRQLMHWSPRVSQASALAASPLDVLRWTLGDGDGHSLAEETAGGARREMGRRMYEMGGKGEGETRKCGAETRPKRKEGRRGKGGRTGLSHLSDVLLEALRHDGSHPLCVLGCEDGEGVDDGFAVEGQLAELVHVVAAKHVGVDPDVVGLVGGRLLLMWWLVDVLGRWLWWLWWLVVLIVLVAPAAAVGVPMAARGWRVRRGRLLDIVGLMRLRVRRVGRGGLLVRRRWLSWVPIPCSSLLMGSWMRWLLTVAVVHGGCARRVGMDRPTTMGRSSTSRGAGRTKLLKDG